jgi:hypothetical protein
MRRGGDDVLRQLRPIGPDGDRAMRLIEVSRALHRASIALDDMEASPPPRARAGPHGAPAGTGDARTRFEPETAQDNISRAIALVDELNADWAARPADGRPGFRAVPSTPRRALHPSGQHCATTATSDPDQDTLARIASDLDGVVAPRMFEATLILRGALQFDCDHDAVQRIESAIALLDDTVRQARIIVFGHDPPRGAIAIVPELPEGSHHSAGPD